MVTIFVDFDDTLCLHQHDVVVDEFMFATYPDAVRHFYRQSYLNEAVVQYLLQQQNQGKQIVLLTMSSSKMLEIKKYWLQQNCPELKFTDYLAVSIDTNKTATILAYLKKFQLQKQDVVLIDDSSAERWTADHAGILTYNPQLIMQQTQKH